MPMEEQYCDIASNKFDVSVKVYLGKVNKTLYLAWHFYFWFLMNKSK